jgi:hypothetical protein
MNRSLVQPQGLQALMPQRPQANNPMRPAMPQQSPAPQAMQNPQRMGAAMGLVDNDLEQLGIDPKTRAAMKAQEAVDLLASADADMAMAQPKLVPEQIVDQRKQQASEGIRGLLSQLMPGLQQRGQQMQARPSMAMGGMGAPARPAPARPPMGGMPSMGAPNMNRMAMGGIVGYMDGGDVEGKKPQIPMVGQTQNPSPGYLDPEVAAFLRRLEELNKQLDAAFPQEKDLFEQKITDLLNTTSPRVKRIASESQFGLPKQGMARGGIVGYAGPDGSEVELDPEFVAIIEEIRASAPEPRSGLEASQETAAKLKETFGPDEELMAARAKEAAERRAIKAAYPNISGPEINTVLERRSQQRTGRNAVGVNKPMDLGGIAGLLKPKTNANFNLIDDSKIGTAEGGMGKPQTETTTKPEQGILERMRTNQAAVTPTTRTPSTLAAQLETVLGGQLGALDGARDKETALAEAALGVSEAEKQAAEELVKADEAYYGKVLDPAERRRRENEVIMQAYLSGNSLVDQARRSGAAQSQLRRQGYTQEREAAKVRPTATREQEQTARGIRGQVYEAGRGAEKDARSTLNQTIQTTGNYINSIANREAQTALESSRQSMQILAAEMDVLLAGQRLDEGGKDRVAMAIRNIRDTTVDLRELAADILSDPTMDDADKQSQITELNKRIREHLEAIRVASEELGLPTTGQAPPTGGSNVTPEQQAADAILGI